jgi:hypothetical protein
LKDAVNQIATGPLWQRSLVMPDEEGVDDGCPRLTFERGTVDVAMSARHYRRYSLDLSASTDGI